MNSNSIKKAYFRPFFLGIKFAIYMFMRKEDMMMGNKSDNQKCTQIKKGELKASFDKTLIAVPIVLVAALSVWFFANPEGSLNALNNFGNFFVSKTGWFFLVFSVFMVCFSAWWAFGKYGKVKLGGKDAKPKYSMGGIYYDAFQRRYGLRFCGIFYV